MGVFNRLIMIVLALSLVALGVWFVLGPIAAVAGVDTGLSIIRNNLQTTLVIAGILAFVGFVLFLAELLPSGRRTFVATLPEGTVEYGRGTLIDMLQRDLREFEGVENARVDVGGSARRVDSRVRLRTDGTSDARDLASRVGGRIRDRLERLNLGAGSLKIAIEEPTGVGRRRRITTHDYPDFADAPVTHREAA
jgi:hypothetical protein